MAKISREISGLNYPPESVHLLGATHLKFLHVSMYQTVRALYTRLQTSNPSIAWELSVLKIRNARN